MWNQKSSAGRCSKIITLGRRPNCRWEEQGRAAAAAAGSAPAGFRCALCQSRLHRGDFFAHMIALCCMIIACRCLLDSPAAAHSHLRAAVPRQRSSKRSAKGTAGTALQCEHAGLGGRRQSTAAACAPLRRPGSQPQRARSCGAEQIPRTGATGRPVSPADSGDGAATARVGGAADSGCVPRLPRP